MTSNKTADFVVKVTLYFQLMPMRVNNLFHLSVGVVQRQVLLKVENFPQDVLIHHISVVPSL